MIQNEIFIAFMVGWMGAIGFMMISGFLLLLYLKCEKTKIKKLELEKIVCATKCKLKELEYENLKKTREKQKEKI